VVTKHPAGQKKQPEQRVSIRPVRPKKGRGITRGLMKDSETGGLTSCKKGGGGEWGRRCWGTEKNKDDHSTVLWGKKTAPEGPERKGGKRNGEPYILVKGKKGLAEEKIKNKRDWRGEGREGKKGEARTTDRQVYKRGVYGVGQSRRDPFGGER